MLDKNLDLEKKLRELVLNRLFGEAKQIMMELSFDEASGVLIIMSFEDQNIMSYVFVNYLISQNESANFHILGSNILCSGLCHLNHAYQAAFFHVERAIELEPDNIEHLESLLFFYGNPEKLLSRDEAKKISSHVLKEKPSSQVANRIIKE